MSQKPGSLTADLLSKKPPISATGAPAEPLVIEPEPEVAAPVKGEAKSLSCKVDAPRYLRLSLARVHTGKSAQEILSEGLDLWLKKNKF